ncbi:MAG: VOC family protein [Chitinophagales bacterium]|nr:VOC family protein [Chitinophagales bacterium]
MPKDKYPWSENYTWVEDKYKVNWQLYFGKKENIYQTLAPTLMFCNSNFGKAKEAAQFYVNTFNNAELRGMLEYEDGNIQHGEFLIEDYLLMIMDGPGEHHFSFTEGISLVVNCKNQDEIDFLWETLSKNGGQESRCGWLKDKFGISWQIIPENLGKLLSSKSAIDALMQMNKIEIEKLK